MALELIGEIRTSGPTLGYGACLVRRNGRKNKNSNNNKNKTLESLTTAGRIKIQTGPPPDGARDEDLPYVDRSK